MATFVYSARNRAGEKIEGTMEATDRRAALLQIERQGQIPVSVSEKGGSPVPEAKGFEWAPRGRRARMSTREVLIFTSELSDLLASGMKLGNALNSLASRGTGRAGEPIVAALRDDIVQGSSLSDALARHPHTFSNLYVSMISAGEASGALAEVLRRLVTHFERVQEIKEKVVMALVYPMIVITLGAATLVFSMVYVIPRFKTIFEQLGETLPLPTRILIGTSSWLVRYGWAALIALIILFTLANRGAKTKKGRLVWDRFLLKLPLIRGIIACGIYANFARTLGTLLSNGVPVLSALKIVERTVGNAVLGAEIGKARERVTDGTTISGPLAAGKMFPPALTDMLAIGEQAGDMPGSLAHIARRYENELDRNVKVFTTALEPILIVLVAIMVGFVAVSILMAVFNLTNGLNV
ncbi:type II secretion system F family protein [Verrucomicrobiota bacterium]